MKSMRTWARVVGLSVCIATLLLVAACKSKGGVTEAAQPEPVIKIKRIAIMPVEEPAGISLGNRGGVGSFFGVVGQIVEENVILQKSAAFSKAMRDQGVRVGADLQETLRTALTEAGFEVSVLTGTKPAGENPDGYDYASIKTDADAILHAWYIESSFYSHRSSLSYKPRLNVSLRLVSTKTREDLTYQYYYYGADARTLSDETIPADEKYAYRTYDALMANTGPAAESLKIGAQGIGQLFAKAVAKEFR